MKLNLFWRIKLLEGLVLAKYLISVATPLNKSRDAYLRITGYYVSQFLFSFFSDKTFFSFFPFFHFCIISLLLLPVCLDVMSHANNFVLIRFFVFEIQLPQLFLLAVILWAMADSLLQVINYFSLSLQLLLGFLIIVKSQYCI